MEYPLTQSAWSRAKQDTHSVFHTIRFWVVEMTSAPIIALGMYLTIPNSASTLIKTIVPIAAFSIWMLADAKQRKFDVIVAWKADRLSRGMYPASALMEVIEPLEIKLEAVEERLDMNYFAMLAVVGKMELDNIRARTMMGKRAGARAGKFSTGGKALFGYDISDGKRIINEEQAELIRKIFGKVANDQYTLYRVAAELNRNATESPGGNGKWSTHTVHRLLINPAYKGEAYAFRYKVVEPKRPKIKDKRYSKTTHLLTDRKDWIPIPGVPAIVSPDLFEAAQRQMDIKRKRSPRNRKHNYLLSGRLRCGVCGHSMIGSCKKKPNGDRRLYRCICNVKPEYYDHCDQRSISADLVENSVWEEIKRITQNPDLVLEVIKENSKEPVTMQAEQILLENNIKQYQEQLVHL